LEVEVEGLVVVIVIPAGGLTSAVTLYPRSSSFLTSTLPTLPVAPITATRVLAASGVSNSPAAAANAASSSKAAASEEEEEERLLLGA
jgi:hypothetical protein